MLLFIGQRYRMPFLVSILALVFSMPQPALADSNNLLDTLTKAWKARQARANTLDLSAVGTEYRDRTETPPMGVIERKEGIAAGGLLVTEGAEFKIGLRIVVEGNDRFRYDYQGKAWVPGPDGYPDEQQIDVFDRGISRFIIRESGFPSAHFKKDKRAKAPQNPFALPIILAYRPLKDGNIGVFDAANLMLTGKETVVDGRRCVEIGYLENFLWVDPILEFLPIRYRAVSNGVTRRAIDITYALSDKHGWIPKSWRNVRLTGTGGIEHSMNVTVTSCEIGRSIPDETFNVELPPGTWVRDYSRQESYILRSDGSRREVLKSEDGKDYEYLLRTNPGNRQTWLWILNGVIILLIVVTVLLYLRFKRRGRASLP